MVVAGWAATAEETVGGVEMGAAAATAAEAGWAVVAVGTAVVAA